MEVDNQEWKIIKHALRTWEQEGKLTALQAEELTQSFQLKKTGQQIARYFFLIGLSCSLMAFGAIFIDEKLLEKFKIYFSLSNVVVAILMAILAGCWLWYVKRKSKYLRPIIYEIYLVPGGLAILTSLVYICKDFGFGPSYSVFLLVSTVLLATISFMFQSQSLWIGTMASALGWFAAFSYANSIDHIFLGMNYPMRFTVYGLFVLALSFLMFNFKKFHFAQRITYLTGFIVFFAGLWGVSVFGNYNSFEQWVAVRQTQVLLYSFVFGAASLLALYLGIRYKEDTARDLGVLFLLINFYSRYFEYFWDTMHKGIFFLILAVSFWIIGKWIERKRKN